MTAPDEGGEAPCFAHILDEPPQHTDEDREDTRMSSSLLEGPNPARAQEGR